ncbi:MAG: 30S ribosomal protein S16 [Acidimicrobiaceae bacterium TMED130]|nr:MAG: 30S ribosomal protein S16 [Acidimicrobiaceae bacterium TMED130]
MAVKLRLVRTGKRKQPTYRLVAADSRSPRNGRFIEIIGTYEPRQEPSRINIDNERAIHWLRNGAKPTERVEKLLRISGAWEEFTGKPLEPITYQVKEESAVEESAVEESAVEESAEAEAPVDEEESEES